MQNPCFAWIADFNFKRYNVTGHSQKFIHAKYFKAGIREIKSTQKFVHIRYITKINRVWYKDSIESVFMNTIASYVPYFFLL